MGVLIRKVGRTLTESDTWFFGSLILFIAYFTIHSVQKVSINSYLQICMLLAFIFCAVIAFAALENKLKKHLNRIWYWSLFLSSFVLIPALFTFLLILMQSVKPIIVLDAGQISGLATYSIPIIVLTFLLIRLTSRGRNLFQIPSWFRRLTLFHYYAFIVLIVALFLPFISNEFQEMANTYELMPLLGVYLLFVPQIFLIYLSYYLFYYINHKLLFHYVFQKRGLLAYLVSCLGLILLLAPIQNGWIKIFPVTQQLLIHPMGAEIHLLDEVAYLFPIWVMLLSFPLIIMIEWNRKTLALKTLEQEKTKAELALLKQQINPHFFFNTLNNLYALSLDKSDQAPAAILKLSKLMRFVIYKGQQEFVPITDEVEYLKDYIDLQKLRIHKPLDLKLDIEIEDEKAVIPPLLLINLLENAYKHGIEPSEKEGFIHLTLKVTSVELDFFLENSLDNEIEKKIPGIGLQNLRQRLEIHFPDAYTLESLSDETYKVRLKIQL